MAGRSNFVGLPPVSFRNFRCNCFSRQTHPHYPAVQSWGALDNPLSASVIWKNVFSWKPLKPIIHSVFPTRSLRGRRSAIGRQTAAPACQSMADRLPRDFMQKNAVDKGHYILLHPRLEDSRIYPNRRCRTQPNLRCDACDRNQQRF